MSASDADGEHDGEPPRKLTVPQRSSLKGRGTGRRATSAPPSVVAPPRRHVSFSTSPAQHVLTRSDSSSNSPPTPAVTVHSPLRDGVGSKGRSILALAFNTRSPRLLGPETFSSPPQRSSIFSPLVVSP